ncbi:Txe/YoeB family addiction module toxin [Mucilaginibacter daejeonensis]|uniref:Txe/YoeB family addiction module toxin n=1 Tax=Mucilaginibacter daejeonensis TaxID=398049 RepID=UPI001D17B709|nr:Txe/YoeB family addiction module toxin [Mucilaginibacter daejeonensis]UEG54477.1 Txe/YoeB family addiction module toxin [Mucilaginibacter daejeonensis]
MEMIFSPKAIEDLEYWKRSGNKAIQKKITTLLVAIQQDPFKGIGKPEPLKYGLSGAWSRRIDQEHRLVYEVNERNQIIVLDILSLRGHYR